MKNEARRRIVPDVMTAIALARPRAAPIRHPGCGVCVARGFTFCDLIADAGLPTHRGPPLLQEVRTVAARRTLFRANDVLDYVPVICSGWAVTSVMLSDGSRQILHFLLPGDIVLAALLFDPTPICSVEAVTDVTYRAFNRADLRERLFSKADLAEKLAVLWTESKRRSDEMIIDLGRRAANERVARLLLRLVERLQSRNMTSGGPFEVDFPLRQHHIADAVGLTPVHVSKLLSEFRRSGIIRLSERSLAILDPDRLRNLANVR
ncbi:MAG: Crp/Fnr family transcriptional regulator [Pseudolabrys sp.]